MTAPTNYDVAKVIRDLLTIAKVGMPEYLYMSDTRVHAAQVLLGQLNASQHRPPSVPRTTPVLAPYIGEADPSDPLARQVLTALGATPNPEWDVAAALDAFMSDPAAPATRPAAIAMILRDWLVAHGYLKPQPDPDDLH